MPRRHFCAAGWIATQGEIHKQGEREKGEGAPRRAPPGRRAQQQRRGGASSSLLLHARRRPESGAHGRRCTAGGAFSRPSSRGLTSSKRSETATVFFIMSSTLHDPAPSDRASLTSTGTYTTHTHTTMHADTQSLSLSLACTNRGPQP